MRERVIRWIIDGHDVNQVALIHVDGYYYYEDDEELRDSITSYETKTCAVVELLDYLTKFIEFMQEEKTRILTEFCK